MKMTLISALIVAVTTISCSTTPPTRTEQRYFNITTNVVEVVSAQTNTTPDETIITYTTNILVRYEYAPGPLAIDTVTTIGHVVNYFAPGIGGLITGALLGVLSIYARLRRSKKTSEVLAQGIEVYGEVVKLVDGVTGKNLDAEVKTWLQNDQVRAGVIQEVLSILERSVDNEKAKKIAQEIRSFIAARQ